MLYSVAIERLKYDEKRPEKPRYDFDNTLSVNDWTVPGGTRKRVTVEGAPAWWTGDEDASQQFLASVGVMTNG